MIKPFHTIRKPLYSYPSILTEMLALLKTEIQKMRNISVNSQKGCAS